MLNSSEILECNSLVSKVKQCMNLANINELKNEVNKLQTQNEYSKFVSGTAIGNDFNNRLKEQVQRYETFIQSLNEIVNITNQYLERQEQINQSVL